MSKETNLDAEIRAESGKSAVKKVLAAGKIPSVIYGLGEDSLNIALDKISVQKEINSGGFLTRIISLNIAGKKSLAIPRDVQFDPLSDQPIHVDFLRLAEDSKITLDIPTRFINEESSPGLKRGGVLNVNRRTVQLSCPANNIPEEIVFDLLPQVHRKAYTPAKNVIKVDFSVIKKGKKTAAGHFGKAVKGKFIRYLAQNNIQSIDKFSGFEYDGFKWNGEQFIKEIVS